jgi:hypothetical protein
MKSKSNAIVLITVLLISLGMVGHCETLHVSPSGGHEPPYASWETAATNIQDAVDAAREGDLVLLGAGTYALCSQVEVSEAMTIRGAGQAQSVVDGGESNRCFLLSAPGVVLEHLTARAGSAEAGGAVRCKGATLRNCTVQGSRASGSAGGGIFAQGPLTLESVKVLGNAADYGAGVACLGALTMADCTVSGNVARVDGGGLRACAGSVIEGGRIRQNCAGRSGGGIDTTRGAALRITNATISGNSAGSEGDGGGLHVIGTASATLRNCALTGNRAGARGGGAFNWGSLELSDCAVEGNRAGEAGGGMFNFRDRTLVAEDSSVRRNTAPNGPDCRGRIVLRGESTLGVESGCTVVRE